MVEVFPGQPLVQLNGTVQEMHAQAKELNPEWKPLPVDNTTTPAAPVPAPATRKLTHLPDPANTNSEMLTSESRS
jgi:hypothetical protein